MAEPDSGSKPGTNPMLDAAHGFAHDLGIELDEISTTRIQAHLDVQDRHLQPYGVVHGGVYCALAETLASVGAAVAAAEAQPGKGVLGLENHTSFVRAVGLGRRVEAEAVARHAGRRVQLWTVTMRDAEDGRDLAVSTVRLLVVDAPPA